MRRGYDRVEGSIGRSYNEIKGVTMSVSRKFHMPSEITTGVGAGRREKRVAGRCGVD